jgi:cell division protein ZapA
MSAPTRRLVPVRIQGREYRIRADGDGEAVQRAAELVEQTIERVRHRAATVDSLDVAMLAALNLANSVVSRRSASALPEPVTARMGELIGLLEAALGDAEREV